MGVKHITIYDNDIFDVVNNPRHIHGISPKDININKAEYLSKYYSSLYPMLEIHAKNLKFSYDHFVHNDTLIFNTTGGSNYNMFLNSIMLLNANKDKQFSFIDIFVEPFALGVHSIVVKNKGKFNVNQ